MEKTTDTIKNLTAIAQGATAVSVLHEVAALSDRYAKQFLTRCEADGILGSTNPQRQHIRKHALDAFGDLKREMLQKISEIITD